MANSNSDNDTSLISLINANQLICTINTEECDIPPNNSDDHASLVSLIDVNQMICTTNTEECHVPTNSDDSASIDSTNSHAFNNNDISEVACTTNTNDCNIPSDPGILQYLNCLIYSYTISLCKLVLALMLHHKFNWPLQYPLLFPRGEDGYRKDIEFKDNPSKPSRKRQFITQLEWVGYRIQQRHRDTSTIVFSRRLFHQFLVDSFSTIESARLKYLRNHQKDLRADMYRGLTEAVLRGETNATTTGKRIVLPANFVGGPRYMIQNYQDAMAICSWAGYPDLFITFTCNHKWPEVVDFLKTYQLTPADRPDLVTRLFKIKLDQLIKDIKQGSIFGRVKAVIYTIEFQKCGLPHAHILVFLQPIHRIVHPHGINKIISTEIPDKDQERELFNIVSSLMIHGPCGDQNKGSPCMQKGRCIKYFPKRFVNNTMIDSKGYPVYRRRDNGVFVKKGESFADNRFVVPYNRRLLLKYNAHINVEWCNQSRSIKYIFKYVNKGHDRVTAGFYRDANPRDNTQVVDEIKKYYDCRYLSACEAVWRIFVFDVNYREPSVERLSFHRENEQPIVYPDEA
ncbi:uncharacterized protein LOC123922684 [Trifolium pratense]|uniref:uncharacterized protein LOC123922684 n=1 Tax=Trifolium pratense TaxID=57577 RepID=UPI001E693147|nr:uncharacterized protein LOC123922684 [Trifolium pratense]